MLFQYCACCVCKNPPYASFSLLDDCLQSELSGGIETTCRHPFKHKKMAKKASFIVAVMKMLQSPHISKKRLLLDTQKMALLVESGFPWATLAHAHQNIYSRDKPKRLIRGSESYNDHIMEHILLSFVHLCSGPIHKNEPGLNSKCLWLKVKWAAEILL